MSRHEDCAACAAPLVEKRQYALLGLGVDLGGRFVADENVGIGGQRHRKPSPGCLAAGQLRWQRAGVRTDAEPL